MIRNTILLCLFCFVGNGSFLLAQQDDLIADISTIDIDHFWEAYDSLVHSATKADSIATIQRLYLDRRTEGLEQFLQARDFTAPEYAKLIRYFPKFWTSIRSNTLDVKNQLPRIQAVFKEYKRIYPDFTPPKICFAIGCLRTGGTVGGGYLLIGTEISAADSLTDKSELNQWLKRVLGKDGDVTGMVAHETVHFLQKKSVAQVSGYFGHRLLMASLIEGAADFIAEQAIGKHINAPIYEYGDAHEAELWQEFQAEMLKNDMSNWLYNGNNSKDRPADLGYYIGYKICESYYEQAEDKFKAIAFIINMKGYKRFLKKSGYGE